METWELALAASAALLSPFGITALAWLGSLALAGAAGRAGTLGRRFTCWFCGYRFLGDQGLSLQRDRAECGAVCLDILAGGEDAVPGPPVGLGGISMAELAAALRRNGSRTRAVRFPDARSLVGTMGGEVRVVLLVDQRFYLTSPHWVARPAEALWRLVLGTNGRLVRHWIVAWEYDTDRDVLVVRDPFLGGLEVRLEDLERRWVGVGLVVGEVCG